MTANFGETGDTEPSKDTVVIEVSKETAKAHTLDYGSVAREVVERLSGLNVSDDTINRTIDLAIEALRKEDFDVSE